MKMSTLFKLDLLVIAITVIILLAMTDFSQPQQLDILGCITDTECGCIDDCLDHAVLTDGVN